MLVAGSDKAEALQKVLGREYEPLHYPAQLGTWENPNAQWFVDSAAASLLPR
jgi:6-phosphogluconolactonase/glucosamine-6-phosphate isomerase/deaminase